MARPTLSRAAPWRLGIAVAAAVGAVTLAGPTAMGALSGGGGQPPAGSPAVHNDAQNAPSNQPAAGAPGVASNAQNAPNAQPANTKPQPAGKPAQVSGPEEPAGPKVKAHGRDDKGGANGAATGGRKD